MTARPAVARGETVAARAAVVRSLAGAACLWLLVSCASAPVVPPSGAPGPTGGLGMRLWHARTDTRQYEYFVVGADGSLAYGGGMKAFERQTEWSGRLSDEEGARLRAIVDAAGWLTAAEPSAERAANPVAEMVFTVPGGERDVRIAGPDQAVDRAMEVLGGAAKRRFDRFMQRLPEAGVQPRP